MRNNKFPNNIEDQIKNIVQNAINNRDFYRLNKEIENTVGNALSELRKALGSNRQHRQSEDSGSNNPQSDFRDNLKVDFGDNFRDTNEDYKQKQSRNRSRSYRQDPHMNDNPTSTLYPSVPVGKVAGILFTVFGWIFLPITSISILVLTVIGLVMNQIKLFGTIGLSILPFLLISLFLTTRGSSIRGRLRRFYRYNSIFKNEGYYSIKDLSSHTQLSNKYLVKDLRKMIGLGMFPEGHLDEQATCIMLNQESYQQYLELQRNLKMQKSGAAEKSAPSPEPKSASSSQASEESPVKSELETAIESGRSYIRQIREANDAIPGEEISKKLDRLEMVIDKIFNHVEEHPEQLTEIEKFMEYYLPTTLKLVTAYKEFDLQPVQGENIRSAKVEIEATLNTINHAFETLLDSLFEDVAMDIATDISVLETILAQEGLTPNKFK